jgi:putative polymerase
MSATTLSAPLIGTARGGGPDVPALATVAGATLFNAALCFLFTRGFPVNANGVAACEILASAIALFLGHRAITEKFLIALIGLFGLCVAICMAGGGDLMLVRDFGIPFAFFALGSARGREEDGDFLVYSLLAVTAVVGLFEWFDLRAFTRVFDIISYYFSKGGIDVQGLDITGTDLFVNGIRPEERMLIPALGDHRVSSIFLEPISIANFAAVSFGWLACRLPQRPRLNLAFMLVSIGLIVLSDSRFALAVCAVVALARAARLLERWPAGAFAPLAVVALLAFAIIVPTEVVDNTFRGRMYGSGSLLLSLSSASWLGLAPLPQALTWDSGYAYVVVNVGVLGAALAWTIFVAAPVSTTLGRRFRGFTAFYIAASLCISGSVFSIKTAALLWFLFGAVTRKREGA